MSDQTAPESTPRGEDQTALDALLSAYRECRGHEESTPPAGVDLTVLERLRARVEDLLWKTASEGQRADEAESAQERLRAERDVLKRAVEQAREHHPRDDSNPLGPWCPTCLRAWPCPTAAALDAPEGDRPCPRCEGSMFEPGTEEDGDWDSGAMRHLPYTGEPCTACNGSGTAGGGQ